MKEGEARHIVSSPINRVFTSYTETPFFDKLNGQMPLKDYDHFRLKVFVGKIPTIAERFNFFLKLPNFLKPAPFNLIYKKLCSKQKVPCPKNIFFNFFDFDVL